MDDPYVSQQPQGLPDATHWGPSKRVPVGLTHGVTEGVVCVFSYFKYRVVLGGVVSHQTLLRTFVVCGLFSR